MRLLVVLLMLWSFSLASCAQVENSTVSENNSKNPSRDSTPYQKDIEHYQYNTIEYLDENGNGIIIQNSLPKGGPYYSPSGKTYGHGIFWNQITNHQDTSITFSIEFPKDSIVIGEQNEAYFKLFLPSEEMSFDQLNSYDYGITDLEDIFEAPVGTRNTLHRIIPPGASHLFYVAMMIHVPEAGNGAIRTSFEINGKTLAYNVKVGRIGSTSIPCGYLKIVPQ